MRYQWIPRIIMEERPIDLLEIGTWNGIRALDMLNAAPEGAKYYGFDVFEDGDEDLDKKEMNVKKHVSKDDVSITLNGYDIELYKGLTKDTLPEFYRQHGDHCIDFAFIDGGHSVETIENDWLYVSNLIRPGGVVLFDDYYTEMDITDKFGCNEIIKNLDYELLPDKDPVISGGYVQIAKWRNND